MAQGRVGNTGYLAGVRSEKTDTESRGWVRSRVLSTAAEQAANPIGTALRDYGNGRELDGGYTKSFPSVHLTRDWSTNWKARLSWSTSFGRPRPNALVPNETVNENLRTLTVNNPLLVPQTARNWDAGLEYYFEPVGSISVGFFHKVIKDFIVSGIESGIIDTGPNNGYSGEYGGYTLLSSTNAGTAYVQGWGLSYQQQYTFLPGPLKGLGAMINFTALEAHGDYGGRGTLRTREVEGFVTSQCQRERVLAASRLHLPRHRELHRQLPERLQRDLTRASPLLVFPHHRECGHRLSMEALRHAFDRREQPHRRAASSVSRRA